MKRAVSLVLVFTLIACLGAGSLAHGPEGGHHGAKKHRSQASVSLMHCHDIEGHWARNSIDFCLKKGLFEGDANNAFLPEESMTRAMFAVVMGRFYEDLGYKAECKGPCSFTDVDSDAWYCKYVLWANENGILDGYGDGRFGPDDLITREQMAAVLYRFCRHMDMDVSCGKNALDRFSDASSVPDWAREGMAWAVEKGLISGVNEGGHHHLKSNHHASRAQGATIFERLHKYCRS